jgi:hypothetical protein
MNAVGSIVLPENDLNAYATVEESHPDLAGLCTDPSRHAGN